MVYRRPTGGFESPRLGPFRPWSSVEASRTAPSCCFPTRAERDREKPSRNGWSKWFRVVAVDPFYFGEGKVADHAYLWALMLGAVGERPLGVQAGEAACIARWIKSERQTPVTIAALGPRTSTVALVAAALEPNAIAGVDATDPLGSLKVPIEEIRDYSASPELFCFRPARTVRRQADRRGSSPRASTGVS